MQVPAGQRHSPAARAVFWFVVAATAIAGVAVGVAGTALATMGAISEVRGTGSGAAFREDG